MLMQLIFLLGTHRLLFSDAFSPNRFPSRAATTLHMSDFDGSLLQKLKVYVVPILVGLCLVPAPIDALPSGGRGGGSSFRSSSSAPSRSSSSFRASPSSRSSSSRPSTTRSYSSPRSSAGGTSFNPSSRISTPTTSSSKTSSSKRATSSPRGSSIGGGSFKRSPSVSLPKSSSSTGKIYSRYNSYHYSPTYYSPSPVSSTVISSPSESTLKQSESELTDDDEEEEVDYEPNGLIFVVCIIYLLPDTIASILTESKYGPDYTILKLQVALNLNSNKEECDITKSLYDISKKYSSQLLDEVATVLRDYEKDWFAASMESDTSYTFDYVKYPVGDFIDNTRDQMSKSETNIIKKVFNSNKSYPKIVVVSLVYVIEGKKKCTSYTSSIKSVGMLRTCLQQIAVDARKDGGNNVVSAEVLWSPGMPTVAVSEWNLAKIYPKLDRL
eukprot:gene947-1840_t